MNVINIYLYSSCFSSRNLARMSRLVSSMAPFSLLSSSRRLMKSRYCSLISSTPILTMTSCSKKIALSLKPLHRVVAT